MTDLALCPTCSRPVDAGASCPACSGDAIGFLPDPAPSLRERFRRWRERNTEPPAAITVLATIIGGWVGAGVALWIMALVACPGEPDPCIIIPWFLPVGVGGFLLGSYLVRGLVRVAWMLSGNPQGSSTESQESLVEGS